MLPTITIDGRLVADPDLKFSAKGKGFTQLRVASSDSKKDDAGQWETTEQLFVSATFWNDDNRGPIAETVAEQYQKGSHVIITGRLYQREYETNTGEKRTSLELKFPTIAKVSDAPRGQGGGQSQQTRTVPANDPWGAPTGGNDEPPF